MFDFIAETLRYTLSMAERTRTRLDVDVDSLRGENVALRVKVAELRTMLSKLASRMDSVEAAVEPPIPVLIDGEAAEASDESEGASKIDAFADWSPITDIFGDDDGAASEMIIDMIDPTEFDTGASDNDASKKRGRDSDTDSDDSVSAKRTRYD